MEKSEIWGILEEKFPADLVNNLQSSYYNALREYKVQQWQYFGNEIGQFIEIIRRMLEYVYVNTYTPLTEKLKIFNNKELINCEGYSQDIPESFRIMIPRVLYSMACLRNKRGMIHKSEIDPNKMDATILLNDAKWILAELVRLSSSKSFEETQQIVDAIICRENALIWDTGSTLRVTDTKMATKEKILCLLYVKDGQSEYELRESVEYKNTSDFRKILKKLHKDRYIEYSTSCSQISPLGIEQAEILLNK